MFARIEHDSRCCFLVPSCESFWSASWELLMLRVPDLDSPSWMSTMDTSAREVR